jgi:hypothetical protein
MSKVMAKEDYLRECMSEFKQVPIDIFNTTFCLKCYSSECARSQFENSAFNNRITNWQKILFTNVPRASDEDPRFGLIRGKRFLPVDRSVSSLVTSAPTFGVISPETSTESNSKPAVKISHNNAVINTPDTSVSTQGMASDVVTQPEPVSMPVINEMIPDNTPFVQGMMLPGAPESAKITTKPEQKPTAVGSSFTFED